MCWGFPGSSPGKESTCNAGDPVLIAGSGRSPGEGIDYPLQYPCGSAYKESACNVGDLGLIPELKHPLEKGTSPGERAIPWRREWLPTPVFLPGKSHGQRSLMGYSSWGRTESDTTEALKHSRFLLSGTMCSLTDSGFPFFLD